MENFGITKEMFQEYEDLRKSGIINMFGARSYLGWEKKEFCDLIKHYNELCVLYPDVREIK